MWERVTKNEKSKAKCDGKFALLIISACQHSFECILIGPSFSRLGAVVEFH